MKSLLEILKEAEDDSLVKLTVDTYEAKDYPVVKHVFIGKTREEAQGYYEAHLETDKFLAGCEKGKFGDIVCRNELSWSDDEGEDQS